MSIEMENLKSILEKLDLLTTLIEQMLLAHSISDDRKLNEAHKKASELGFELIQIIDELSF